MFQSFRQPCYLTSLLNSVQTKSNTVVDRRAATYICVHYAVMFQSFRQPCYLTSLLNSVQTKSNTVVDGRASYIYLCTLCGYVSIVPATLLPNITSEFCTNQKQYSRRPEGPATYICVHYAVYVSIVPATLLPNITSELCTNQKQYNRRPATSVHNCLEFL